MSEAAKPVMALGEGAGFEYASVDLFSALSVFVSAWLSCPESGHHQTVCCDLCETVFFSMSTVFAGVKVSIPSSGYSLIQ